MKTLNESSSIRSAHFSVLKPLVATLALIYACIVSPTYAQSVSSGISRLQKTSITDPDGPRANDSAEKTGTAPRNAYADNLRPKIRRSSAARNQAYAPIKKYDDDGQIPELEMFVGESRVFPTPGVARIAVGNGQILTAAALDGKETILFANGVGTSSLFVWNEDGRYQRLKVSIVPGDTTRIAREIAAFLTTIPNSKASIVGDKVIVEGERLSDADISKIELLEKRYPQIINFTNRLGWEKMVMLDVKVVEFPVDELREIGVKWSATGGAAIGGIWRPLTRGHDGPYQINIQTGQNNAPPVTNPADVAGTIFPSALNAVAAANLGLNGQLALLAQNGKASILAEPQLAARSGSKASFLAGGEFPYSVSNLNGVTVIFKPYGIKLDIQPKVDRNGTIRATIDSEVSKIDPSVSTAGGPALLTRKTNTEFNVRSGETIVLSGLIQVDNNTNIDKVPLLGDLPILGALFRSKRFQNKETELVVFVTPTIVDSQSPGLVDRVQRTTERLHRNLERDSLLTDPLQPGHDLAQPNFIPPSQPAKQEPQTLSDSKQTAPTGALRQATAAPIALAPEGKPIAATYQPAAASTSNPMTPSARTENSGVTLRILKEGLILRSEPNRKSTALLHLARGAVVQLGAAENHMGNGEQWRNVVVGALNGWVPADSVELSRHVPATKASSSSPLARHDRDGRDLGLGRDGQGGSVSAAAPWQISAAGSQGSTTPSDAERQHFRVDLDQLALRVTPDINAQIIQHLTAGQIVVALPQNPSGSWRAVQVEGAQGWVASQWLAPVHEDN
ncbi:MAG TPA: pilus assembly protein N-terminal domain-containing protein [Noviherbaspirillum sp.]|nr:pilus assembly protein N-terminal domain-containing protein [Noviherbaspirillum sp.]